MRVSTLLSVAIIAAAAAWPASATPYRFSTNSLTNFTVNAPNAGTPVTEARSFVQATGQPLPVQNVDPLSPAPSCVGLGPCPAVNNPAPLGASGSYLRAGARIGMNSEGQFSELDNHAESFLAVGGTGIGATRFKLPFSVTDPGGLTLNIAFTASPYMQVSLDAGDTGPAAAALAFRLAIAGITNGFAFTWTPDELNQVVTATLPGQTVLYNDLDGNPTTFDPVALTLARSVILPPGDYALVLAAVECIDCPEPATWTVFAIGLAGMAFRRHSRRGEAQQLSEIV